MKDGYVLLKEIFLTGMRHHLEVCQSTYQFDRWARSALKYDPRTGRAYAAHDPLQCRNPFTSVRELETSETNEVINRIFVRQTKTSLQEGEMSAWTPSGLCIEEGIEEISDHGPHLSAQLKPRRGSSMPSLHSGARVVGSPHSLEDLH